MSGLIIDSFAGGGGASLGIEWALGRSPDIAINHDAEALMMHRVNHPKTLHLTENIWKVDPLAVTKGKPVFLLWASPDCRHHSKAKGSAPVSRSVRGLANVVLLWAELVSPQIIMLENVEEFQHWGPLDESGKPSKARKGEDFRRWVRRLEALGYEVDYQEGRACDDGAPTIRKRLCVVARRDRKPILWPKPTHGKRTSAGVIAGKLKPYRTAAEIIEWDRPCPSIFLTKAEAKAQGLRIIRPLAENSEARIAQGFKRRVLDVPDKFIVITNHSGKGFRGCSLSDPLPTVTASRDAIGLVTPFVHRDFGQSTGAKADAPIGTITAGGGGHCAVVAPILTHAQQGGRSRPADEPVHTICASTKDQNQLAAAFIAQNNTGEPGNDARAPLSTIVGKGSTQSPVLAYLSSLQNNTTRGSVDEPVGTILAGGNHHAVVTPFIQSYYSEGSQDAAADQPLPTVPTKARFSPITGVIAVPPLTDEMAKRARQVAAFLRKHGVWDGPGEFVTIGEFIVWDIGMRMLTPRELARAQGFPESYDITAGGTLTETAQRHKIGNSVSPQWAAARVRANCIDALALPDIKRRRRARFPVIVPASKPAPTFFDQEAA